MSTSVYSTSQDKIVQSTINYKQFKLDSANRVINQDHLMSLYDAISAKNLLREFPIVVDRNMTVLDGQHRLKAAESLEVPIYFIVSDRASIDDIASTNSNTAKWKMQDYFHRWCASGNIEYLKLKKFWDKYNFLKLSLAANLCHYGDRKGMTVNFKHGLYRCNDVPFAIKVAEALLDFSKYPNVTFFGHTPFVYAVSNLMANANYDHAFMMERFKSQSTKLVPCVKSEDYIKLLGEIYNYRTHLQNRVQLRKLNSNEPDWRPDRKAIQQMKGIAA